MTPSCFSERLEDVVLLRSERTAVSCSGRVDDSCFGVTYGCSLIWDHAHTLICAYTTENVQIPHILRWMFADMGPRVCTGLRLYNEERANTLYHIWMFADMGRTQQWNISVPIFIVGRPLNHEWEDVRFGYMASGGRPLTPEWEDVLLLIYTTRGRPLAHE